MPLKALSLCIWMLILVSGSGCKSHNAQFTTLKNDTAEIIRVLIDSAFRNNKLPDKGKLGIRHFFSDSILFKFDSTLMEHAPQEINGLKFKFLTEDQICQLVTNNYDQRNDTTYAANYLKIQRFDKKNDTLYIVELQNAVMVPPQFVHSLHPDYTRCIFGEAFGGGIQMKFVKQGDSLRGDIIGLWPF